ncbi:MAG: cobalt transporter subunit CbtB [Gammaproteobacteria bacterium]
MSTQTIDAQIDSGTGVAAVRNLHAFLGAMLGLVILFGVGFAPIDVVHNAAHDGRHSLAVPCH